MNIWSGHYYLLNFITEVVKMRHFDVLAPLDFFLIFVMVITRAFEAE
jgi:hypothetical protein